MPTPTSINTNNNGVGGAGMNYETTEYIRNGNNNYTGIIMSSSAANANSTNPTVKILLFQNILLKKKENSN